MQPPCIFPTLRYRDPDAAIEWLVNIVGFREHVLHRDAAGLVAHAQLAFGSSIVMLGQARDDEYGRLVGDISGRRTDAIYVAVEDIGTLYDRFGSAGVTFEMPLHDTDYGSQEFACRDPEGNLWSFGTYWPQTDA